jgi:hypothetical protein
MSYVSEAVRPKFESLSIELKNEILSRNVRLENLSDLIAVWNASFRNRNRRKTKQTLLSLK